MTSCAVLYIEYSGTWDATMRHNSVRVIPLCQSVPIFRVVVPPLSPRLNKVHYTYGVDNEIANLLPRVPVLDAVLQVRQQQVVVLFDAGNLVEHVLRQGPLHEVLVLLQCAVVLWS